MLKFVMSILLFSSGAFASDFPVGTYSCSQTAYPIAIIKVQEVALGETTLPLISCKLQPIESEITRSSHGVGILIVGNNGYVTLQLPGYCSLTISPDKTVRMGGFADPCKKIN